MRHIYDRGYKMREKNMKLPKPKRDVVGKAEQITYMRGQQEKVREER